MFLPQQRSFEKDLVRPSLLEGCAAFLWAACCIYGMEDSANTRKSQSQFGELPALLHVHLRFSSFLIFIYYVRITSSQWHRGVGLAFLCNVGSQFRVSAPIWPCSFHFVPFTVLLFAVPPTHYSHHALCHDRLFSQRV